MKITSPAFLEGENIPSKYTADGQDISPPLVWSDIPAAAKSLALICDDPDAPVGLFVHWLVADIPPNITQVDENSVPKGGKLVINDFRQPEYGGPSPPSGTHRYFFKIYALSIPKMEGVKDKKAFYQTVEKTKIAQASLMGKYQRQKKR